MFFTTPLFYNNCRQISSTLALFFSFLQKFFVFALLSASFSQKNGGKRKRQPSTRELSQIFLQTAGSDHRLIGQIFLQKTESAPLGLLFALPCAAEAQPPQKEIRFIRRPDALGACGAGKTSRRKIKVRLRRRQFPAAQKTPPRIDGNAALVEGAEQIGGERLFHVSRRHIAQRLHRMQKKIGADGALRRHGVRDLQNGRSGIDRLRPEREKALVTGSGDERMPPAALREHEFRKAKRLRGEAKLCARLFDAARRHREFAVFRGQHGEQFVVFSVIVTAEDESVCFFLHLAIVCRAGNTTDCRSPQRVPMRDFSGPFFLSWHQYVQIRLKYLGTSAHILQKGITLRHIS